MSSAVPLPDLGVPAGSKQSEISEVNTSQYNEQYTVCQ